jgi:hypothetical protein
MATWNTSLASRFGALAVALPLLLAPLLTGCSGDDEAQFTGLNSVAGALAASDVFGQPAVVDQQAVVGQHWSYQPAISSPESASVTVTASNLPDWMTLNQNTGRLEGIPGDGDVRTWTNIRLTVNNGQQAPQLQALTVTVVAQGAATGTATVTWSAPTQRVDGSPIGELAGYRVLYGKSSRNYDHTVEINTAGINRYVLEGLGAGTWYFAVQAITSDGLSSAPSREVNKTI